MRGLFIKVRFDWPLHQRFDVLKITRKRTIPSYACICLSITEKAIRKSVPTNKFKHIRLRQKNSQAPEEVSQNPPGSQSIASTVVIMIHRNDCYSPHSTLLAIYPLP